MRRSLGYAVAIALCAAAAPATAQQPVAAPAATADRDSARFELTVANIMRGPELVGEPPELVRWTPDGRWIYFRWKPGGRPWYEEPDLYRVRAAGGEPEQLTDEQADSLGVFIARGDDSADLRRRVVSHRGDLYLIDSRTLALRRLTATKAEETDPVFGGDGRRVFFVRDDNVFSLDLDGGGEHQLTDLRRAPRPPEDEEPEGQRAFLKKQQEELFETIRIRERLERERKARDEAREKQALQPVFLGKDARIFDLAVDPAGRFALLTVGKEGDETQTLVPKWVTETGYVEELESRPKVGDDTGFDGRMGLVDLTTGSVEWLDLGAGVAGPDTAAADTAGAPTPSDSAGAKAETHRPKYASVAFLGWSDDRTKGLIGAVSYDYKDQWLNVLDTRTGELRAIAHDHDDAWIGGPCDPWLEDACAGWLPDGDVWFISERDGWSHLFRVGADGSRLRQLTSGRWEVQNATLTPDHRAFFFHSTEVSPFQRDLFRMSTDGGARKRLTTKEGLHEATPSPDGTRIADVYSFANQPPELFVAQARAGAPLRRVTTSPTAEWSSFPWIVPQIVRIPARDGVEVPARIYRPADMHGAPNGAGIVFVHGAGYLHNVHMGWSDYSREYMFNQLLASRGYVVLDIDYRGSAGYGRDWRTAIYRHMGGTDLTDQVDGVKYLVAHEGVRSPDRVGIYGGSYGGFITLMALFTQPDWFGAGAALRAVTDWAHYNHWYTSRILNLPQDDSVAYRRSSPIYFAEGLQDPLLIAHGMQDTNVEFQDVVRLAQRLIELKKTGWTLAPYPVENHGFIEPASWTDEYRRILALFERTIGGGGIRAEQSR